MKQLAQQLSEALLGGKDLKHAKHVVHSKDELINEINAAIKINGPKTDLNYIDVSNVTDMSKLFEKSKFNGDISKWNVSSVKNMWNMFKDCKIKEENKPKF